MMGMFDPEAAKAKKEMAATKKKAFENIKSWVMESLPDDVKEEVETVASREFQCGDPTCAPIDTAIQVFFIDPKKKPLQTGLPKECHMLTRNEVADAVDSLLNPPAEPEFDPISRAAEEVYEGIVSELFGRLNPLSFGDKLGVTQRLFAAVEEFEQTAMAQQAAAAKAKRAPQNPAANLLLSFAQQNKPEDIQRVLDGSKLELRWGALDPSEGNSVGQTALHVACLWGNLDAAVCLVQNKADVNRCNTLTGGAPLHITCTSPKALEGRLQCAKLLLDHGADPLREDSRGMTPVAYAAEEPEMAALLAPYAAARSVALAAEAEAAALMGSDEEGGSDDEEEGDDDGMPELEGGAPAEELLDLE